MSSGKPIITLANVCKRYGGYYAVKNISLEIDKNEFVLITGPSGAGKSTLLKLLYLGETVSGGRIDIDGIEFSEIKKNNNLFEVRKKLGVIFQDIKLINSKTIFENIAFVLEAAGMNGEYIKKQVVNLLRIVGMDSRMNSYPPMLSGGEQQKVAIARAIALNPDIIIADEPTASLDYDSANEILDILMNLYFKGATIILATHDKRLMSSSGCRHIHIERGEILRDKKLPEINDITNGK